MSRYSYMPRSALIFGFDGDPPSATADQVIEREGADWIVHTGLFDANGERIYRVRRKEPFGFVGPR